MARCDPLLWLLNVAQTVAAPVLLLKKWRRYRARGDCYEWDAARWTCRLTSPATTGETHVVLVAMGFAETRLAARLTTLLRAQNPRLRVTWAIRNLEAARQGDAIPNGQAVVPLPFDYCLPVRRWIKNVQPDVVVFIERFQFPNLARALHNHGVKVAAVAARSRQHKGSRYGWGGFYARWFLGAFDLLCFRSVQEASNLGQVPASTGVVVTGSLKFWPQLPDLEAGRAHSLKQWLETAKHRPLLAAGSTQPGDEDWVFEAFAPLRAEWGAVLLLAPRQVARVAEIEKLVQQRGWKSARRSQPEQSARDADVLLLDTLGELTHAYGAAHAAFVGGTITGTGHNVLEPITHGIPVFFGPKRGTFGVEQEMCEAAGVGFRVQVPAELQRGWDKALRDTPWRSDIAARATTFNEQGAHAWMQTAIVLAEFCEGTTTYRAKHCAEPLAKAS